MCVLCKEWVTSQLNIKEIKSAGLELLSTVKDPDDLEHIVDRIAELEKDLEQNGDSDE